MSEKIYTIEEIKKMLEELLRDKPVYQVILFGSYAKQKATKKIDGFEKYEIIENSLIDKEIKGIGVVVYGK